jgi:hypothetical protein
LFVCFRSFGGVIHHVTVLAFAASVDNGQQICLEKPRNVVDVTLASAIFSEQAVGKSFVVSKTVGFASAQYLLIFGGLGSGNIPKPAPQNSLPVN